jgi:iduronate 2-sulfatase
MRNSSLNRRKFLTAAGISVPALLLGQKAANQPMNVLFIASDDLDNNLGCYGHPMIKTPNLDRLAATGTRFERAYCQVPLCCPSRTSLLTGLRPDTTKVYDNDFTIRQAMPNVVTLPELFRKNKYLSARYGKIFHMGVPVDVGTNKWDDPQSWDISVSPPGLEHKGEGEKHEVTKCGMFTWVSLSGDGKGQADDGSAAGAEKIIEENRDKPWFIGLGFVRPHTPLVAPSKFFDLYPLDKMKPVENPADDVEDIPKASEIAVNSRGKDCGGLSFRDKQEILRGYFASISYMDSLVGRVLDKLEKTGQAERTVVVFWGDNGYHLGEHFRWQKRSLFEESMRIPLIIRAPGRKGAGKPSKALVELVDLYPTVAELCGVKPPGNLEGQSLVPLLDNPDRKWKLAAFSQIAAPGGIMGRGVRTDRYRYVRWEGPYPDEELYDEEKDPREFTNLARQKPQPAVIKEMRAILDRGWKAARAKV